MKEFVIILLLGFIVGCSPIFYAPNSQNVPMFTEQAQGEFGFGQGSLLSLDGGNFGQTIELQSAYSFYSHWAAQVNYMTVFGADEKNNYIEGAFGYFLPFDKHFVFEFYPGFGFGNSKNGNLDYNISTSYSKIFVQPSIGYVIKRFEVTFSSRLTYLNYYNIDNGNLPVERFEEFGLDKLESEYINIEPAISMGFRFEYLKLEMQWYATTPIGAKYLPSYNRGAIISLSYLLKKRK